MKILITGGNGFVGRSLTANLTDFDVVSITRKDLDLKNTHEVNNFFNEKYFDVVIHTAVRGGSRLFVDDSDVIYDNIVMYHNILSNKSHFGKLINIGSGAEIYTTTKPYGLSKEIIYNSIMKTENFYNLRVYGLFGVDELNRRFIKSNMVRYIKHEPMIVDKNKYMSFFYIDDLVKLIKHYLNNDITQKSLDCVYRNDETLLDIARIINGLSNYHVNIEVHGTDMPYVGKFTDIGINYVGLENGIKEMYNLLKQ